MAASGAAVLFHAFVVFLSVSVVFGPSEELEEAKKKQQETEAALKAAEDRLKPLELAGETHAMFPCSVWADLGV